MTTSGGTPDETPCSDAWQLVSEVEYESGPPRTRTRLALFRATDSSDSSGDPAYRVDRRVTTHRATTDAITETETTTYNCEADLRYIFHAREYVAYAAAACHSALLDGAGIEPFDDHGYVYEGEVDPDFEREIAASATADIEDEVEDFLRVTNPPA